MGIRGWRMVGITILAVGFLALAVSGGQAGTTIGFSVSTQVNPFYKAMADGVRDEAKAQGMEATILNAEDKLEKQIADVEDLIQKKVDVIIINATHDGAAAVLNKAAEAGIPFVDHVRIGDVAKTIAHFARDHDFDKIVMGTRGMGAIENLVMGSISTKVIHLSDVPVTLVK